MNYLGIDVGGTSIKAGLVDDAGRLHETRQIPTIVSDLDGFTSSIVQLVGDFQKGASIAGIGIGVPGLHSSRTRTIETSPNIPCLRKVNLEEGLGKHVRLPIITENDANAGAYGESVCGAGRGLRHLAYLTIGTGLGGGIVLGGKLYRGASGYAGEIGHTSVELDGRLCGCGAHGCLETRVSASGIVATATECLKTTPGSSLHGVSGPLTSEAVYEAAIAGDAVALQAFEITGRYLGAACSNLINLLNLEMIAVAGGVMASGPHLLDPAIREVQRRAFASSLKDCKIVQSELWPNAGMIGAAMLARDRE